MRKCPKCGYEDPPYWRHSIYSYWLDFTEYENFEMLHPELCPLPKGGITEDETFVYRRMKRTGNVERKAKVDYEVQDWYPPMEKHDYRKYWDRPATKLTDFSDFAKEPSNEALK